MTEFTRDDSHVDERSYNFFSYGYGRSGYAYRWNSTAIGLTPTLTLSVGGSQFCAYCGKRALPIQQEIRDPCRSTHYVDVGHCCVCKEAMDELEIKDKILTLIEKQAGELKDLKATLPKINPAVAIGLLSLKTEEMIKRINKSGIGRTTMGDCGIGVRGSMYE